MNVRLALYDWIGRYQLDAAKSAALLDVAGLSREPAPVAKRFWPAVAVLATLLAGLGVILWLAANWKDMGRMGRFALLEGAILVVCGIAAWRPNVRAPLALLGLLLTGGLFAYFGQTYQTGADAWQLFAVWAALSLPLAFSARSDIVWAPWTLVVVVGISLWTYAHTGHRWWLRPESATPYFIAWVACIALVAAFTGRVGQAIGAGVWARRTAATLAVVMISFAAILALFHDTIASHYWLALLLCGLAAALLARPGWFDVFVMSAVALALDTLLVAGLVRLMFHRSSSGDSIGKLMMIGLFAAGLLAATVSVVLKLSRQYEAAEAAHE